MPKTNQRVKVVSKDEAKRAEIGIKRVKQVPATRPAMILDAYNATEADVERRLQSLASVSKSIFKSLTKHVDYGNIPGTDNLTLLQPGADKIRLMYGLRPRFELVERVLPTRDNDNLVLYSYKCELYDRQGNLITEAIASANNKEKQNGTMEAWQSVNNRDQMAQKRAFVKAIRGIGNLAAIFTQNIDGEIDFENLPMNKFKAQSMYSRMYRIYQDHNQDDPKPFVPRKNPSKKDEKALAAWKERVKDDFNKRVSTPPNFMVCGARDAELALGQYESAYAPKENQNGKVSH